MNIKFEIKEILGFKKGYLIFNTILFLSMMPITVVSSLGPAFKILLFIFFAVMIINAIYIICHLVRLLFKTIKTQSD